jgi:hypothetical protein
MKKLILFSALLSVLVFCSSSNAEMQKQGRFLDELILKDLADGRNFELIKQFRYLDPAKITWVVPAGEKVDGASIPQVLWSIIGGPWSGKYRRASVIHDYFFRTKKYESGSVHRVFYDAMLTDGVSPIKAKVMYYAVLRFNDRWEARSNLDDCGPRINCLPILADEIKYYDRRVSVSFDEADLKNARQVIETQNLSIETIEQMAKNNLQEASK